jgi:hypothetical protein
MCYFVSARINIINGLKIASVIGSRTIGYSGSGSGEINKDFEIYLILSLKHKVKI